MRLRWLLPLFLFVLPAFGAGGTCPSGTNYTDPNNPQGALKTLSSLGVTSCYFISATGADTNTGTDEAHPWAHAPLMPNCVSNCAAVNVSQGTQIAGTGFIFHGGDTWHYGKNTGDFTGGTWNWNPSSGGPSGTASNPIYIGVDATWFSGGSWARPIMTADNSPCGPGTTGTMPDGATCTQTTDTYGQPSFHVSSCPFQSGSANDVLVFGNQQLIQVDNLEFTGLCQSLPGISGGGSQGQNVYVLYNSITGTMTFENLYIHGASHLTYAGPLTSTPCNVANSVCANNAAFTGGSAGGSNFGDSVLNSVVDFSDSDPGGSFLCIAGGLYNTQYNVFRYFTSCLPHIHNFSNNLVEDFFENGHSNLLESQDPSGTNVIYNNTFRHIENLLSSNGGVFLWLGPVSGATDYIFNNVMYDVGNGEYLNIGGTGLTQIQGNYVFFNNTWQTNFSQSIVNCQNQTIGTTADTNNHYVDDQSPYTTCSHLTTTTGLVQTNAAAKANISPHFDQYSSTETFGYSPLASTNSTVGVGTNENTNYCGSLTGAANTACKSDTTYGVSYNATTHTVSFPNRTTNPRPASAAWDIGAYVFPPSGPTFSCTPVTVPANHSTNISLSCTGNGTNWSGSTTFTVTGVSGTVLVSKTNNSATSETITITTGSGTGTLSINDTTDSISTNIQVSLASLSISPNSGNVNTTPTLTLTGTNTIWSTDITAGNFTASSLFSVSGASCTGDSLGSASSITNTGASAVLTTGSTNCTATITDNSTTSTAAFTISGSATAPTVTTGTANTIRSNSAVVSTNSYVCTGGCTAVTSEGTCYSTTANPTSPCTSDGTTSPWNSNLMGLNPLTTYHYRAFATNSVGTGYGADQTFTTASPGTITYVSTGCTGGANATSASNSFSFACTPNAANDAIVFNVFCHGAGGIPTSATMSATGWNFTQLVGSTSNGTGAGFKFGSVVPNTNATNFIVTFAGVTNCANFYAYMNNEYSGENPFGGAATFPTAGSAGGTTGGCNQSGASVTPNSNNDAVDIACIDVPSSVTAPFIAGSNDAGGGDLTEYQILSGGKGTAITPAFGGTTGAFVVMSATIAPVAATFDCFQGMITNSLGQTMPNGTGHPHQVAATCSQSGTVQTCTVPNGALFSMNSEPMMISGTGSAMDWSCPAPQTLQNGTSFITNIVGNTLTLTAVNSATITAKTGTIRPARFYVQSLNWGGQNRKTLLTPQNHPFFHEAIGNMLLPAAGVIAAKYGGSNCTAAADIWNETLTWNFNGIMDTSVFNIDSSFNSACAGTTLFPEEGAVQEMTQYSSNNLFTSNLQNGVGAGYINQAIKNLDYAVHQYTCTGVRVANLDNYDSRWATFVLNFLPNFNNSSKNYYKSPWVIGYPVDDTDFVGGPNAGPEFHTFPHNHNTCDPALQALETSPVQTYNNNSIYGVNHPYFYPDTAAYTKLASASPPATCSLSTPCTFRDYLQKKYGTIASLNAAWSSTYTTFDSSGKCIGPSYATSGQGGNLASGALCTNANTTSTSETIVTGGGSINYTFANHPVDPFSVKITNAGSMIAGDCPAFASTTGCPSSGSGNGEFDTKLVTNGSITSGTAILTTATAATFTAAMVGESISVSGAGVAGATLVTTVLSFQSGTQVTLATNASTTVTGTGIVLLGEGCITVGTDINYSTGVITGASTCSGAVTVDYTGNGWDGGGTGLMDESGVNTGWTGTNGVCLTTPPAWQSSTVYAQWSEVQDAASGTLQIASTGGTSGLVVPAFSSTQGVIVPDNTVRWFSLHNPVCGTGGDYAAANANPTMGMDIDNWSQQYYAQYLAGLTTAISTDFPDFIFEGPIDSGVWSTPPRKLYIQALANANPAIAETSIGSAQYDSAYPAKLGFFTQFYTGAMTNIVYPCATQGPATCGSLFPQTTTISALGQAWYTIVNNMLGDTTSNGNNQWVGIHWWERNPVNGGGMGIVTALDNAFDGNEDVVAVVPCSAPNAGLNCGGESAASTWTGQNMLVGAQGVAAGNALWMGLNNVQTLIQSPPGAMVIF